MKHDSTLDAHVDLSLDIHPNSLRLEFIVCMFMMMRDRNIIQIHNNVMFSVCGILIVPHNIVMNMNYSIDR